MALVFDYKNIDIQFFSNEAIDGDRFKKKLIVYPVLAYKVYAPVIDDLNLNLFQKYVLSILNKGNFSLEKIAEWLSLDLLLVKTIAVELNNKELIDINKMDITTKGKQLIEGSFSWFENAENLRKDIRYVFQDIYTEELYPVILSYDNFQSNVYIKEKQVYINSKGKKDTFDYVLIEPKVNLDLIRKPETTDILNAINKHVKKYLPNSKNDIKEMPNAVSYMNEEPDLKYCAMWVYVDKNNTHKDELTISDPFNIYEETYWLRDTILKAKKQNKDLNEVVDNLLYTLENKDNQKASSLMIKFEKEVEKELNKTFDFILKTDYKDLYEALKEYYADINYYNIHKKAKYLKNALRKSQIALETLFKIIYNNYKEDYEDVISNQTYSGARFSARKDEIITKIKTINKNAQIPNWNFDEFKGVYNALKNPEKASLLALFIAGVLVAYYNNDNPIYKVLKEMDNFSICIENIAKSRNKVSHKYEKIKDDEIDKYFNDVKTMQKDIEKIIQIVLNN